MQPFAPDVAAAAAARTIALQMLEERGRGAVLVGVARVDAALEHLLQALMAPGPMKGDGLFLPDRPLGSLGAKVGLARRLCLIDAPVERALSALRKLRNAFAHSTEAASLADPAHRLAASTESPDRSQMPPAPKAASLLPIHNYRSWRPIESRQDVAEHDAD